MMNVMDLMPNAQRLQPVRAQDGDREAWLAARRTGIGGSDVAAILGLSRYKTAQQVFLEKTGAATTDSEKWVLAQGHAMEPVIAERWARTVGAEVFTVPMLRDREHPHRLGNFDRLAIIGGQAQGLECKWTTTGVPDVLPVDHYVQVTWYQALSGLNRWDVTYGAPWDEPFPFPVIYDADLAGKIIEAVDRFWYDNVLANVMPLPMTRDERLAAAIARSRGAELVMQATAEAEELARAIIEAKAQGAAIEERTKDLIAQLTEVLAINGAAKMTGAGWSASFVDRVGSIDWKALSDELGIPKATQEKYRKAGTRYLGFYESRAKNGGGKKEG